MLALNPPGGDSEPRRESRSGSGLRRAQGAEVSLEVLREAGQDGLAPRRCGVGGVAYDAGVGVGAHAVGEEEGAEWSAVA
jgi:hypothetical protein